MRLVIVVPTFGLSCVRLKVRLARQILILLHLIGIAAFNVIIAEDRIAAPIRVIGANHSGEAESPDQVRVHETFRNRACISKRKHVARRYNT